jgi:hypothetical protein
MKYTREEALFLVKGNGYNLERLDDEYRMDPKFIKMAAKTIGNECLEFAHPSLFMNEEFMFDMIINNWRCFKYLDEELKTKKKFLLRLLNYNSPYEHIINSELKNDRDFTLEISEHNSSSSIFYKLNPQFQNDKEIALSFVSKNPNVFEYLIEKFRNSTGFVLDALQRSMPFDNSSLLEKVSDEMKNNKSFALKAIQTSERAYCFLNDALKNDKDILVSAIDKDPTVYQWFSDKNKENKELALLAVGRHGRMLEYTKLKDDPDVAFEALRGQCSFCYVGKKLKNDKEFVIKVLEIRNLFNNVCVHLSDELKNDKDVLFHLLCINPGESRLPQKVSDKTLILKVLKTFHNDVTMKRKILLSITEDLIHDMEIHLAILGRCNFFKSGLEKANNVHFSFIGSIKRKFEQMENQQENSNVGLSFFTYYAYLLKKEEMF